MKGNKYFKKSSRELVVGVNQHGFLREIPPWSGVRWVQPEHVRYREIERNNSFFSIIQFGWQRG